MIVNGTGAVSTQRTIDNFGTMIVDGAPFVAQGSITVQIGGVVELSSTSGSGVQFLQSVCQWLRFRLRGVGRVKIFLL